MCFPKALLVDMTGSGAQIGSLRFSGPESRRLTLALALSLAVHLLGWGGYELGKTLNVWQYLHLPSLALFTKAKTPPPQPRLSEPIVFVDVSPAQAPAEPPKTTPYFGVHSSVAANPDTKRDTDVPELKGTQSEITRTRNAPRAVANKAPPMIPSPQKQEEQLAMNNGDLTLANPSRVAPQEQQRPRTLKQALAQMHPLPSEMMKQEGGVRRHAIAPSLDVKVTGFSDYDRRFIEAVTQHWYDLLESQKFTLDRRGKVVLQFHLNYDGSITDMKISENSVGDLLGYVCQKAVMDNAPFERWPTNMRLELGDRCNVQFTFYYTN